MQALVACRLEVYKVALGEVFDAGDVVVYPFRRLQSCYLLLLFLLGKCARLGLGR
jgi:hypothetical protein